MSEPLRLPQYRDAASKRPVPLGSASYTVLHPIEHPVHEHLVSSAGRWGTLEGARSAARTLLGSPFIERLLVVRPAGLVDEDDYLEEIRKAPSWKCEACKRGEHPPSRHLGHGDQWCICRCMAEHPAKVPTGR